MVSRDARYSHYRHDGTPLELQSHLEDVATRARDQLPADATSLSGGSLQEFVECLGWCHDVGKATSFFQTHLDGGNPRGPSEHAFLGALVAYHCLDARGFGGQDPLLGFVTVARHHNVLPNVAQYGFDATSPVGPRNKRDAVAEQVADIDAGAPDVADDVVRAASGGTTTWHDFVASVEDLQTEISSACSSDAGIPKNPDPAVVSDGFYEILLRVWGALLFADKTAAAEATTGVEFDHDERDGALSRNRLEAHVDGLEAAATDPIDRLRAEAHDGVMDQVDAFARSNASVGTITLPTGLGKTLTSLHAATELRDRSPGGRIVYALPFTSIIDQVGALCREIFDTSGHDDVLTIDHYLAETFVELRDGDADSDDVAHVEALLGDSWRSGGVVTTFVQLFESLAGPPNSWGTKLPALGGSVVVLDEPQSLPEAWWPLARRLVTALVETFDATVLVVTATQPRIFAAGALDTFELVPDPGRYYGALDRVEFEIHPSGRQYIDGASAATVSYADASGTIASRVERGSSVLAICNTIDSVEALAERLRDDGTYTDVNARYDAVLSAVDGQTSEVTVDSVVDAVLERRSADEAVLVELTTRHRPIDRRMLLDATKRLLAEDVPVLFVATQLVEAGVDISFDSVVRDFAPLNSLVQAAGRCNRSGTEDTGTTTIWRLAAPPGKREPPSTAVYGTGNQESLLKITARAIEAVADGDVLGEAEMTEAAVAEYYRRLHDREPGRTEWVDYVDSGQGLELAALSLIDSAASVEVVVARTSAEAELLAELEHAFESGAYETVSRLEDRVRELRVSVPIYDPDGDRGRQLSNLDPLYPGAEIGRLDARRGPPFSAEHGLSLDGDTVAGRFL